MKKINKEQAEKIFNEDFIEAFDIPLDAIPTNQVNDVKSLIIYNICNGRVEFDKDKQIVLLNLKIPIKFGKENDETIINVLKFSINNCNYGLIKPIQDKFEEGDQMGAVAFFTGENRNAVNKMCSSDALTAFQICAFFFLY